MSDDYSAGAIYQLWSPMIKGAVDSDARCHGLAVIESGFCWYDADTSTYIDAEGNGSGPGGGKQPLAEARGWNPRAAALHWAEVIPPLFDGWDTLPDPTYLGTPGSGELGACYRTISKLALNPESTGYQLDAGDPDFTALISHLNASAGGFNGQAMIDFSKYVASRIAGTARLQSEVAAVLAFAIQAEQSVWKEARRGTMKISNQAVSAFERAYPGGGGGAEVGEVLGKISATAGVLALVPSGPGQALFGAIGALAGLGSAFAGDASVTPTPLDAESPQAVCDKITQAFADLDGGIKRSEGIISSGCSHVVSQAQGALGTFGLARPAIIDEDDPRDILAIDVELDRLKDLAYDTVPDIAEGFHDAQNRLSGALGPLPWERPDGKGANPYGEYAALVAELDVLLGQTRSGLEDAADKMAVVAKDFGDTDDLVDGRFAHATAEVGS